MRDYSKFNLFDKLREIVTYTDQLYLSNSIDGNVYSYILIMLIY